MVEFAMVSTIAIFVLLIAIQYAMIGQAALALSQAAFQGARFASVNPAAPQSDVQCFLAGSGTWNGGGCTQSAVASPTITKNSGHYLTLAMSPTATPRTFGQSVTVTLTFDVCGSGMLILGTRNGRCGSFFGIAFPTTLTATETAMSE